MSNWRDPLNEKLDEELDEALARYGEAPACGGLEQRVLARVATSAPARSARPLLWAAAAVLVAIMASLTWRVTQKPAVRTSPTRIAQVASKKMESLPLRTTAPQAVARVRPVGSRRTTPKLAQFPTPAPMTGEERALIELFNSHAGTMPEELADLGRPIKPVEIAAVKIRPIELRGSTKE